MHKVMVQNAELLASKYTPGERIAELGTLARILFTKMTGWGGGGGGQGGS